ncbi:MAG: mannitol dehydrogenase family protein [Lachnospiraceae bacterium]
MRLTGNILQDKEAWASKGYSLPQFDRAAVTEKTKEAPFWLHFGAGNIFRAFQANIVQNLLNDNTLDKGLIVAEGYDYEIIEKINHPYDNYSILVTLKSDGSVEKTITGSIVEAIAADSANKAAFSRLKEIFCKDSLQMVSFTITEKGYSLTNGNGELFKDVKSDMENGPENPSSYIGKVASLLYTRYQNGAKPVAMVSMDNCSHNGDKLRNAITSFAEKWTENGTADKEFLSYVSNPQKVSFPWSMIDKITPRPDAAIEKILSGDGVEGLSPVITSKNTYIAPFVNAEECEYLVIEDNFPNGRPPLEKGGIIFTDRETVDKVEKMKVCTCLNPLHTALAVFGCLLGYKLISDEMKNPALKNLAMFIGYKEGLPVVTDPGILNPEEFINTVLNVRIPNPFMPDTPQRIATDTSQKLAIRFGETIKAYKSSASLDTMDLKYIPLVFAGWLRYLMGIDDNGNKFELSPDPMLGTLCPYVSSISLGDNINVNEILKPILADEKIFGISLYDVNIAGLVCRYFTEMIAGTGAVQATLDKYVLEADK